MNLEIKSRLLLSDCKKLSKSASRLSREVEQLKTDITNYFGGKNE